MAEGIVYDVIVVGAGIVGSYTAYHARKAGKTTLLLEQFPLPHNRGSSHGQSRTIRSAYGAQEYYTKMMNKAFRMWKELEEQSNKKLLRQTGLLCIGQKGVNYLDETAKCLQKNKTPFRRLDDENFQATYPMLSFSPEIGGAVVDCSAGFLLAGRALTAIQNQYRKIGGLLKDGEKMVEIIPGEVIRVRTDVGLYQAKTIVLCVGPWAKKVLTKLGVAVPLQTQKIKVCLHYGPAVDPDYRDTVDDNWVKEALQKYVIEHLPGLEPYPVITESCIYTNTPDEDFILDRHPSWGNIVIGAGFSGHGFKLAPVVGEILSKMATGLIPDEDMSYFKLNRFTKSRL